MLKSRNAATKTPRIIVAFQAISMRYLPFADAATVDLPLLRLLRLSLFQVSVAIATVLLTGTLNRVMVVELGVPTSFVALMIAIPVLAAPMRVLIGHRSDNYKSVLGWRRVPYIWLGTLTQFGGLAIMPFALLLMHSHTLGPAFIGPCAAMVAFLITGLGMHMTQTAGLALATDLAPEESRPRVVALMYVMLLVGMVASALVFGQLLQEFSPLRLIQVVQGCAVATILINVICLWKQEPRNKIASDPNRKLVSFADALQAYRNNPDFKRLMMTVGLGAAGFAMQDVLLEPYGGEILGLSVSQTTMLTAISAGAAIIGFALAAKLMAKGKDMHAMAGFGMLVGVVGFSAVIFAEPFQSPSLFRIGTAFIGFGGGLFGVGTMLSAMRLGKLSDNGIAIGAWGAVQATAAGIGIAFGGLIRDGVNSAVGVVADQALSAPLAGYAVVYHIEIALLFAGIIAIGPLVGRDRFLKPEHPAQFGLAEFPG